VCTVVLCRTSTEVCSVLLAAVPERIKNNIWGKAAEIKESIGTARKPMILFL